MNTIRSMFESKFDFINNKIIDLGEWYWCRTIRGQVINTLDMKISLSAINRPQKIHTLGLV